MRRFLAALAGLLLLVAHANAQQTAAQIAATQGYNTVTFGPNLTVATVHDPVDGYPDFINGANVAQFTFFGTSWTTIGYTQNSDGSVTLDGSGEGYGNGLSTAGVTSYGSLPLVFKGQSFGGGFYAEAVMKGTGPMSFWMNDIETMNGASQNWNESAFAGQPQSLTISGSATAGDVIQIQFYGPWMNSGSPVQINYTVNSGDSLNSIMSGFASLINSNGTLSGAGITASSSGTTLSYTSPAGKNPGVAINPQTISGAFTENFNGPNARVINSDHLEPDIAEFDSTNEYSWAFHNWNGTNDGDINANYGGPLSSCPGGGPSCTWVGPTVNGQTVDFTQYHRYGMLWVPATATTAGWVQYYFDGTAVSNQFYYNQYNPYNGPPPGVGALQNCYTPIYTNDHNTQVCQFQPNSAWSVLDTRHMAFIFGGAANNGTVTFQSLTVYQANGQSDIPVISGGSNPPPTANFSMANGIITDPTGARFIPTGTNVYDEDMQVAIQNSSGFPLKNVFPGINYLRIGVCGGGDCAINGSSGGSQPTSITYRDVSFYTTIAAYCQSAKIVCEFEDHNSNGSYWEGSNLPIGTVESYPPTGSLLNSVTTFWAAMATQFKNNPYVWFGSLNEIGSASYNTPDLNAISTYQLALYNAIRGTGNNNVIDMCAGVGCGDTGTVGPQALVASDYAGMHNVMWLLHNYGSYSSVSAAQAELVGTTAPNQGGGPGCYGYTCAQLITSGDGIMPVIFNEWGSSSGTPSATDGQNLASALTNLATSANIGQGAYDFFNLSTNEWQQVNNGGTTGLTVGTGSNQYNLTTWGQIVANVIAADPYPGGGGGGGNPPAKTAPPVPLTGTISPQTWVTYDQSFSGITLACGKPFHFNVLPPAQYNASTYKYPLLIWLHPDFEGDPWYLGTNTNATFMTGNEPANFNTSTFLANYPAVIAVPYADQTNGNGSSCSGDGNDAVENWGGWFNNGSTGSGTVYSGDTGPNVFALLDMISYLEGIYSIDTTRIYVEGFSLGGIGAEYLLQQYNTKTGSPAIFASGASMAGVLQINGFAAGPTTAQETAMTNVPVWWFGGANDTDSVQSQWNEPMFTALSGGSTTYPSAITSAAANRAGNSQMEYTLCPTCGHQETDASGNPVWVNTTIMNWMFGANASSGGGGTCTTNCTATTWNPTGLTSTMSLSNSNLTASANSAVSPDSQTVLSTTSYSTGKYCFEVNMTTASTNWAVGIANTSYVSGTGGLGSDTNAQAFYPVSPPNYIYYGNVILSEGTTTDSSGAAIDECVDFGTDLIWVSSPSMRSAGTTWNNSGSANPATETGGLSISGLTCPCFIAFNTMDYPSVATLNAAGPFAVSLPSGFAVWAPPVTTGGGHGPLLINLGANDNHPPPVNDNGWETLYKPTSFERN